MSKFIEIEARDKKMGREISPMDSIVFGDRRYLLRLVKEMQSILEIYAIDGCSSDRGAAANAMLARLEE